MMHALKLTGKVLIVLLYAAVCALILYAALMGYYG